MAQPTILELVGQIDNTTAEGIESRVGAALDGKPPALVLDFTKVTFVSSAGLRVLLMAAKRCRKDNVAIALHSIAPPIAEVFAQSGLDAFLPTYESRAAALGAVAPGL
jgi:anti-anti-sigma factor